jgi:hypothetical protein
MSDIVIGIIAFIAFLAAFYLIILILQFLSKVSGKNIVQKGSREVVAGPKDFDNSIKNIKSVASKIDDSIKTLGLDSHNRLIYRFVKILKNPSSLKLSDFNNLTKEYTVLKSKLDKINQRPDTNGIPIYRNENFETETKNKVQISMLELKINKYYNIFKKDELDKINFFFSDYINDDEIKFTKLIDSIGGENLNLFCNEIDNLELFYLKGKVDLNSIRNIKLLILKEKGLISSVI